MRARGCAGLAILVAGISHPPPADPAGDEPSAFVTARLADVVASPADPPTVAVSADEGRYVAFTSYARLTPADTNDYPDVYVLDRATRSVTLETPQRDERARYYGNAAPQLSGNGRFLVYETAQAADAPDAVVRRVVVLRDRWTGACRVLERPIEAANGSSRHGAISADGRTVVFASTSTNLVDGPDANGSMDDVYRFDVGSATITRVSVDVAGRQLPTGASFAPSVSADGRYVAFSSTAPLDGTAASTRGPRPHVEIYVRDLMSSVTTRVSARPDGSLPNGSSYAAAISGDGRYIVFVSDATNLVAGDRNRAPDIFLFDAKTRTTELVSRSETGGSGNGASTQPAIALSGAVVAFQSDASDLTCARRCAPALRDINLVADVFVFDRRTREIHRVSAGRTSWMEPSLAPAVDGTGAVIAFASRHPRDPADDADDYDLFVRAPGR
jgi:Tol biopolymer transport system component